MRVDTLNEQRLQKAVEVLVERDPDLAAIVLHYGVPPMWSRSPGFSTLIRIILEQQVSLSSARAAYNRLQEVTGEITPSSFLELDDANLKTIGFSCQKIHYGCLLAQALHSGSFDIKMLEDLPDGKHVLF